MITHDVLKSQKRQLECHRIFGTSNSPKKLSLIGDVSDQDCKFCYWPAGTTPRASWPPNRADRYMEPAWPLSHQEVGQKVVCDWTSDAAPAPPTEMLLRDTETHGRWEKCVRKITQSPTLGPPASRSAARYNPPLPREDFSSLAAFRWRKNGKSYLTCEVAFVNFILKFLEMFWMILMEI